MTPADEKIERAADKLREKAEQFAAQGGVKAKLAEPLAEDAEFLRKLKPSLIKARARGDLPKDGEANEPAPLPPPQPAQAPATDGSAKGGGPSPFVVIGAALVVGMLIAHFIDWRSHAHPRD